MFAIDHCEHDDGRYDDIIWSILSAVVEMSFVWSVAKTTLDRC